MHCYLGISLTEHSMTFFQVNMQRFVLCHFSNAKKEISGKARECRQPSGSETLDRMTLQSIFHGSLNSAIHAKVVTRFWPSNALEFSSRERPCHYEH